MSKQRLALIIMSIGGMISSILPWLYHSFFREDIYCFLKGGWISFLLFLIVFFISLPTNKGSLFGWKLWLCVLFSLFSMLSAASISGSIINDYNNNKMLLDTDPVSGTIREIPYTISLAYGVYFLFGFGLLLIFFAFILKGKKVKNTTEKVELIN